MDGLIASVLPKEGWIRGGRHLCHERRQDDKVALSMSEDRRSRSRTRIRFEVHTRHNTSR